MFAKGYFEHVSPEGQSASTVAEQYGYEYISIGENIALGNFENDQVLVDAWMNSPGHRANILNKKFTSLGVAVGKGIYKGKSTWIGVQIFARPLSLCTKIDETLKNQIDSENTEVSQLQTEITNLGVELQAMQKQGRYDRDVYNQKVDEYNALAKDINAKITNLKLDIATYNAQVRSFNSCISSE
jgi:prefoldin subunit 5